MPLPAFLLWGAAALLGGVGAKKTYDAVTDSKEAKRIGESAERRLNASKNQLDECRKRTNTYLENLGRLRVSIFQNQIKHMVDMHNRYHSQIEGYNQSVAVDDAKMIKDCQFYIEKSLEVGSGIGQGAGVGALASFGALGAVSTFAAASTGTAIGTLSGAAATNATLAWLGGGSIAAGGFGMTGGMFALGGIALGPLLAVTGFWMASKAEEALTEAKKYEAKVDKACSEMRTVETILSAIRQSCDEMTSVLNEATRRFDAVKVYDMSDRTKFMQMMTIGKGLKGILDVPVLNAKGEANPNIRQQCSGFLQYGYIK
ncbi:MAG: hypothetical protein MJZ24_09585 [Paludibacteraceae bacterium]|nr:hypothetical protein [Paludibacteraceae bacterium]